MNNFVKARSWHSDSIPNDSTPHICDSVLHLLQYPRNTSLDKNMNLRRSSLSHTAVVHLRCMLLMKPAPLSVSYSIGDSISSHTVFVKSFFMPVFWHKKSTRRDSNPRPSPWQGDTPPLSHSCMFLVCFNRTICIILM